ncbi:MAG: hypothetical protein ACM36C_14835 [Acidobacteriota bacterium]
MADTNHDHPLQPGRPSVPPGEQPKSRQSHPAHLEPVDDFEHDATVAHEASDVNIRAIAAFVIGMFVVGSVIYLALWFLMGYYQKEAIASDPAVSPLAAPAGTLPPEPRLLTNEPAALRQLHQEEEIQLKNIEQAKREVVESLPSREGGKAPSESPARAATRMDTSSGRRQ